MHTSDAEPATRGRAHVVLRTTLEAVVWGAGGGAVYGVLVLLALLFATGGPNASLQLPDLGQVVWLFYPALIGAVWGAGVGLLCGLVTGVGLSQAHPQRSMATLRVIAALAAAAPLWAIGVWTLTDETPYLTVFWVVVVAVIPSVIAATVAAVRTPALVGPRPHPSTASGWGAAEARQAAVRELDQ